MAVKRKRKKGGKWLGFTEKEEKYFRVGKGATKTRGIYATEKQRKKQPANYFLDTKNRKYPYRNPDGSINCRLLRAAITRAAQYHHPTIEAKARRLYNKYCKKK